MVRVSSKCRYLQNHLASPFKAFSPLSWDDRKTGSQEEASHIRGVGGMGTVVGTNFPSASVVLYARLKKGSALGGWSSQCPDATHSTHMHGHIPAKKRSPTREQDAGRLWP